jgi:hypothetical protein
MRAEGKKISAADIARLSPLGFEHFNMLGRYSFSLPELVRDGQLRPLRTPLGSRSARTAVTHYRNDFYTMRLKV